jgi:hypothetical protein
VIADRLSALTGREIATKRDVHRASNRIRFLISIRGSNYAHAHRSEVGRKGAPMIAVHWCLIEFGCVNAATRREAPPGS